MSGIENQDNYPELMKSDFEREGKIANGFQHNSQLYSKYLYIYPLKNRVFTPHQGNFCSLTTEGDNYRKPQTIKM